MFAFASPRNRGASPTPIPLFAQAVFSKHSSPYASRSVQKFFTSARLNGMRTAPISVPNSKPQIKVGACFRVTNTRGCKKTATRKKSAFGQSLLQLRSFLWFSLLNFLQNSTPPPNDHVRHDNDASSSSSNSLSNSAKKEDPRAIWGEKLVHCKPLIVYDIILNLLNIHKYRQSVLIFLSVFD